jgi:uncharacterized protein YggE
MGSNPEPNMRTLLSYMLPALMGLLLAAPLAHADDKDEIRSITVTASGQVAAEPDQARITSGVTTEAATAAEALAGNSEAMKKVIASLKESGVGPEDIQTTSFQVSPRYTRPRKGEVREIDGYRVTNQVEVVVRDLDKLGEILDQLVTSGANEMRGLTFEVSKAETLRDEARKEAVANARRRAELYAEAAGAEVGKVLTIQEGGVAAPRPMARAMKMEAVPIERGTQMLAASVTITWALK